MKAIRLRTEYLNNPMGIDIPVPRLMWNVSDGKKQTAVEIRYAVGEEKPRRVGPLRTDEMFFDFPEKLYSRERVNWQVRLTDENGIAGPWSEEAFFEMGLLEETDWSARWITGNYDHEPDKKKRYPADCFFRKFTLEGNVRSARLYITACGIYETKINGKRVGDAVLVPGSTCFQKRAQYQTYDVTELLRSGQPGEEKDAHTWSIELADGYYASKTGVFGGVKVFGYEPRVIGQLEVVLEDGRIQTVVTDEEFSWSNDGPVRFADMKDGEVVDARRAPSCSGKAKITSYEGKLCCSNNVVPREREIFDKPKILRCPDGNTVLDFGQNIAGYVKFHLRGKAGHKATMVLGEKLDGNGNFTIQNISQEGEYDQCHFQTVDYICGGGTETYQPRFTVMGFRYALLLHWPGEVRPEDFTAIAVYSDMEQTLDFSCSHEGVNQIVRNTLWSMKGNFLDVPTDCPTRERAGWTGDAQLFFDTGNYYMDQAAFFRKWLRDIRDIQKPDGMVYNITPANPSGSRLYEWVSMEGSCGWGDADILIPYRYWKRYGDLRIAEEQWESMEKCLAYYRRRMGRRNLFSLFMIKPGPKAKYICGAGRDFGEWTEPKDCAPPMIKLMLPNPEEATAYLSYSAACMAEMADALGKKEQAGEYWELAEQTKDAYQEYFVRKAEKGTSRMCKLVRPCALQLADAKARGRLLKKLVELNRRRNYRIGTGFLSTPFVLQLLTEAGAGDDAFRTLANPEFGWMQQVKAGATTVWENWQDDASLNHYSKGACCGWLFECLCGIRMDGRKNHFIIQPQVIDALEHISTSYLSVYGRVKSGWRKEGGKTVFEITVPPNCSATLKLPEGTETELGAGEYHFI